MIAPLIIYPLARSYGLQSPNTLYPVVFGTTVIWLLFTFLTPAVQQDVLLQFYKKVHPGGVGWKPIAEKLPGVKSDSGFGRLFVSWACGVVLVYGALFGIGKMLFGNYLAGLLFFAAAAAAVIIIYQNLKKISFSD